MRPAPFFKARQMLTNTIRPATKQDASAIRCLISQFGVQAELSLLERQLDKMAGDPCYEVYVYETNNRVLGYVVFHFLPRTAFTGETVFISDMVAEFSDRNLFVTKALEQQVTKLAWARKCDRIQLHCHTMATDRRRLYEKQGYAACEKYYAKRLIYAE